MTQQRSRAYGPTSRASVRPGRSGASAGQRPDYFRSLMGSRSFRSKLGGPQSGGSRGARSVQVGGGGHYRQSAASRYAQPGSFTPGGNYGPGQSRAVRARSRFGSLRGRRWPWLYPAGVTGPVSTGAGSAYISKIQSCLLSALGPWVPQTGVLDATTRAAISAFQSLRQLPPTGVLDRATSDAIQSACNEAASDPADAGAPLAQDASGAAPASEPEPAEGGGPAADATAPNPGAGAGGEDAAKPQSEVGSYGEFETGERGEQEIVVLDKASLRAKTLSRLPLSENGTHSARTLSLLPKGPGVYVIYVSNKPWYVGLAERSIRESAQSRMRAVRNLGLEPTLLKGRSVQPVVLVTAEGNVVRRKTGQRQTGLPKQAGALLLLAHHLINKLGTGGKGNRKLEQISVDSPGSISLTLDGKPEKLAQPSRG